MMVVELEVPSTVRSGEPVPMTLRVVNTGSQPAHLTLTGRPAAFDIVVSRTDGSEVWSRLHEAVIPMVLQLVVVQPAERLEFGHVWDQRDNAGDPVAPGRYRVRGILPAEELYLESEPRTLVIAP